MNILKNTDYGLFRHFVWLLEGKIFGRVTPMILGRYQNSMETMISMSSPELETIPKANHVIYA